MNNKTITNLGEVKPVVVIGGSSADKFIPNVNNSFHDDEFFFNLNCVDDVITAESASEVDGVISQTVNGEKHEYYIDESGRLKWDKVFSFCPDSMRVRFKVRKSAGVNFYYQGELTPEEIADGCERPDDIIGSYAVYCDKANNNYKTGKLCHIPRPFVIDASGNREWCVMTYEEISDIEGMLYIDMPEMFMRNADYSLGDVRLDPTIGYTSIGAGIWARASAIAVESLMVSAPTSNGTASKVYIYLSSGYNTSIQLGYYSDSSLASSDSISSPTEGAWNSVNVSGSISSGELYYPAFSLQSSGTGSGGIAYDSQTDGMQYENNISSLPATWTSATKYTRKFSLYLEYTESGGTGNAYYYQQMQM
jgi:hypothetical protein